MGMGICDYCGTVILFGGVKDGELHFCSERCQQDGIAISLAGEVPEELLEDCIQQVLSGNCPRCDGAGPVGVNTSHTVWSALVYVSWNSDPRISCRKCGIKARIYAAAFSLVLGWWQFPWGVISTPVQIYRNVYGIFVVPDEYAAYANLERMVRLDLARQAIENSLEVEQETAER